MSLSAAEAKAKMVAALRSKDQSAAMQRVLAELPPEIAALMRVQFGLMDDLLGTDIIKPKQKQGWWASFDGDLKLVLYCLPLVGLWHFRAEIWAWAATLLAHH